MRTRQTCITLILAAVAWLALPGTASSQVHIGAQGNYGTETDFGVGGRILGNLDAADLEVVGSFDLYFPDGPADFWEANANLFYHFHLPENASVLPYLGGGLNIGRVSNGASSTEAGLNVGGGVRFPGGDLTPYIEGRGVVSDFDQFVITFGVLF